MSWNYRLMRSRSRVPQSLGGGFEEMLAIHEVFYGEHDEITGWTGPTYPSGNSVAEFNDDLVMYKRAAREPILTEWELPGYVETGAPTTQIIAAPASTETTGEGQK